MLQRVFRIVDDQWTTEPIAVLQRIVRMIPIRPRLPRRTKIVRERFTRNDRTLVDKSGPVCPSCAPLKQAMPMLKKTSLRGENKDGECKDTYNRCDSIIRSVTQSVVYIDVKWLILQTLRSFLLANAYGIVHEPFSRLTEGQEILH